MIKTELVKNSPLRIMEKSTHGGLGKGNLGVIAARKGVGKTAVLVHVATDQLFQDKHVIHVSFSSDTRHIIEWYEEIFDEIARRNNLESAKNIHDEIIRNRVIMNFNQDGIRMEQVIGSLNAMIKDGHFQADMIVVDGFDFTKGCPEDLEIFKNFASQRNLEIWFSCSLRPELLVFDAKGFPEIIKPYLDVISILILLKTQQGFVNLELKKDHDKEPVENMQIKLDPKILLLLKE